MPQIFVIADDLTGAADSGAMFATMGLTTVIALREAPLPQADVVVASTESRHRPAAEAVTRVRAVARAIQAQDHEPWVYKKIDSTLRGHPGPELAALMEALGEDRALVAPAFPAQGRTTIEGRQHVHGTPLDQTAFAPMVPTADVSARFARAGSVQVLPLDVVRQGPQTLAQQIARSDGRVIVADAETNDDLAHLMVAAQQNGIRLLCGSAGLAQALAHHRPWASQVAPPALAAHPGQGTVRGTLIVAGSRHAQTLEQIERLQAEGVPIVRPDPAWFSITPGDDDPIAEALAAHLAEPHGSAVLTVAGLPYLPHKASAVAQRLAEVARHLVKTASPAGLILTGGDIAFATCRALEAEALYLRGETEPGVPWGQLMGGIAAGARVITKAGGFGNAATLLNAARYLADPIA